MGERDRAVTRGIARSAFTSAVTECLVVIFRGGLRSTHAFTAWSICSHGVQSTSVRQHRQSYGMVAAGKAPRMGEPLLGQHFVNQRDRNRPFTDRRGDAFDVPRAHIAHGENARPTRLEEIRRASQRPA